MLEQEEGVGRRGTVVEGSSFSEGLRKNRRETDVKLKALLDSETE